MMIKFVTLFIGDESFLLELNNGSVFFNYSPKTQKLIKDAVFSYDDQILYTHNIGFEVKPVDVLSFSFDINVEYISK